MELHGEKTPSASSDSKLNRLPNNFGSSNSKTREQRISSSDPKKQGGCAVAGRSTDQVPDRSKPDLDGDAVPRRGIVSSLFKGCF